MRCVLVFGVEVGHEIGVVVGEEVDIDDHLMQNVLHIPNLMPKRLKGAY
jgi:predicted metal-dependent phosphoesterase TrpH